MLNFELESCLNAAFYQARQAHHEYLTVEHLLLAILDAPKVSEILKACGADLEKLGQELREHLDNATPRMEEDSTRELQPTLPFQRVLQRAVFHVQSSGKKEVGVANVLVALFSEKESHAVFLLGRQGVTRVDVVRYISAGQGVDDTGTVRAAVMDLVRAYWLSRCVHVVAELGVADALDEEPRTAAELAGKVGAEAGALHRVLRALTGRGIFTLAKGHFSHNDASRLLRTGTPGSLRAAARTFGLPHWWSSYGALEHSVRTGRPACEKIAGQPLFDYLGAHPQEAALFAETMLASSHAQIPLILRAYDFQDARVIGDIGGGIGHLLAAVLEKSPQAQGILFDRPEVIQKAAAAPAPRMHYVAGDFFRDPIPACDVYLVKRVLHDWPDAEAVTILRNIRATAPAGARILVIDGVLEEDSPGPLVEVDIEMLVMAGGRERTREEWEKMFTEAGVTLQRILPSGSPMSTIIEAVA
jgi:hypothetical protein